MVLELEIGDLKYQDCELKAELLLTDLLTTDH
jgi:hypothetical protein